MIAHTEERDSELENKTTEEQREKRKKMKKSKHSLRDLWDTIKWTDIYINPRRRRENERSREYLKK